MLTSKNKDILCVRWKGFYTKIPSLVIVGIGIQLMGKVEDSSAKIPQWKLLFISH